MQHLTALSIYFVVLMSLAGILAVTAVSVLAVTTQRARRVAVASTVRVSARPATARARRFHLGHQH